MASLRSETALPAHAGALDAELKTILTNYQAEYLAAQA